MVRLPNIIICLPLMCLLVLLTGCEAVAPGQQGAGTDATLLNQVDELLQQAAGETGAEKQTKLLRGAQLLANAGEDARALKLMGRIKSSQLSDEDYLDYVELYVALAAADDDYLLIRDMTGGERLQTLLPQLAVVRRSHILAQRADVLVLLGEELKGLQTYRELTGLELPADQMKEINEKIWSILKRIPFDELEQLAAEEPDQEMSAWFSLAKSYREAGGNIRRQQTVFRQWQQQNPDHPGAKSPPATLVSLFNTSDLPDSIAVLLPMSGNLANAGQAIQSGFVAAWFEERGQWGDAPSVRFYDTGNFPDIAVLYSQVQLDGAEMVLGPLDKDVVARLNASGELSVPTIAFNYLEPEEIPQPNLMQMGLSVGDEVEQIALQSWREGKRHALVIYADGNWTQKAVDEFQGKWQELGGQLDVLPPYINSGEAFYQELEQALHVKQSTERKKRLESRLGKPLEFTPQRRKDVDMVFLVAYPDQARQIKPMLNFLYASDLAVYATSHVYNGTEDPVRNRDLDGIKFTAMPWTLKGFLAKHLQPDDSVPTGFRQLYAMGMDAYQLQQWHRQLKTIPGATLSGATGIIKMSPLGEVHREQPWALFRQGKAVHVK